jgi:hypothetical protein
LFLQNHAQPYYGNYYKNSTASYAGIPCIDRCYDGSIIGTSTVDGPGTSFKLFKLAPDGTMLWQKRIELPITISIPWQVCALRDSSIAILINTQNASDFVILRCDVNGQVLSVWNYDNSFTDALFIRPFGHGSLLVGGGFGIVLIDSSGNIAHNYKFNGISLNAVEEKNPGVFTCVGQRGFPHSNLLLFDVDTSGIVSNAYTYPLNADSVYRYSACPSKLLAKSPGGIYCARALGDYPIEKFFLGYFDANHQPVWSRKIEYPYLNVKQIFADRNNGCIVTAGVGLTPYMPAIFKFDSTGTLEWKKLLGDSSSADMNIFSVYDMIPDTGTGWHFSLEKNSNYIFHSDSVFSTFCNTETFQPVISSITPAIVADTLSSILVTSGTRSALNATPYTLNIFQFDACTNMQLGLPESVIHSLELYPNPANKNIFMNVTADIISVLVYNLLGEKIISKQSLDSANNNVEIDVSALCPGIYTVHAIGKEEIWIGKFVKE